jgi:hypothetical protein
VGELELAELDGVGGPEHVDELAVGHALRSGGASA